MYLAMTLAGADSPGEHLRLAAFTAAAATVFIWLGRKQRSSGRSLIAPSETMRTTDRLIPPPEPSRGYRTYGCALIGVGGVFVLPAVFNFAVAMHELLG
ncbi:hypothetical protein ACWDR3_37460 [Streptomyces sp. NPDC001002]